MNRRILFFFATGIFGALIALLAYSLDRTTWLLTLYEGGEFSAQAAFLGRMAALVIEAAAIALMLAEAVMDLLPGAMKLRWWLNVGLVTVLSMQIVSNLVAGWLRGGTALLSMLGAETNGMFIAVNMLAWLISNLSVPILLIVLSKIESLIVRALIVPNSGQMPHP